MDKRLYNIRLNQITQTLETDGLTDTGRAMQLDDLTVLLHDQLSDDFKGASFAIIEQYLSFIGREHAFNPVLDLLGNTPFDGKSRIGQVFEILGIQENDLSKRLVTKWLMQTVALLFNRNNDAFGSDGVLVLNGPQGAGKTSFFRHLALKSAWFGEGICIRDQDKDTSRRAVTVWISELGELESTLRSDVEALKAFITNPVDHYRLPYGRTDIVAPRHTSLCATCNNSEFLIDATGNRRFWTVNIERKITRQELKSLDATQLWAEVYAYVSRLSYAELQSCFRLSDDEQEALARRNGQFEKPVKAQREIEDILAMAHEKGLLFRRMTTTEFLNHWDVLRKFSAEQVGRALKKIGIESAKGTGGKRTCELPIQMKADSPFQENAV